MSLVFGGSDALSQSENFSNADNTNLEWDRNGMKRIQVNHSDENVNFSTRNKEDKDPDSEQIRGDRNHLRIGVHQYHLGSSSSADNLASNYKENSLDSGDGFEDPKRPRRRRYLNHEALSKACQRDGQKECKDTSSNEEFDSLDARSICEKKYSIGHGYSSLNYQFYWSCCQICRVMRTYGKYFLLILPFLITFLSFSEQLMTRRAPTPVKFFHPQISSIVDYEFGDIERLSKKAQESEVSFVMYYAPWDADCINFKKEYEIVAKHFTHQIFFGAINCWYPDGDCRKAFNIRRFPIFMASVRNAADVEYKGPIIASYIIPFLDNLIDPVIPLLHDGDLLDLKSKHEAVAVSYFDFNTSPEPIEYKNYFIAAVKALLRDPWRKIQYAVITSRKVAYKLSIQKAPSLNLYNWNSTLEYKGSFKNSDSILKWVNKGLKKIGGSLVDWITPSGIKSDSLTTILSKHPTFILFTPRSLILDISPYFNILREVVMDYLNCDNSPVTKSLIHRSILNRHSEEERLMALEEKCHEMISSTSPQVAWNSGDILEGDTCCHSQTVKWNKKKCYCTACVHVTLRKCPSGCKKFNCLATASRYLSNFDPADVNNTASYCNEIKNSYRPRYTPYYNIITSCSGRIPAGAEEYRLHGGSDSIQGYSPDYELSSGLSGFANELSDDRVERMVRSFENKYCQRLHLGLNYSDFNFPDSGEGSLQAGIGNWRSSFTGLGCATNRTLKFIALDSILFPHFVENIGIDIFNATHVTVALIVESNRESIYSLNHILSKFHSDITINKKTIYEFIRNFTSGNLNRFHRSSKGGLISLPECWKQRSDPSSNVICVPEVTSSNFDEIVLNEKRDVLLMYYAPWCAFCSSIAHIYLSVAQLFMGQDEILFSRINGDKNVLPFEYTVDRYPSLIFFPAKRKSESVAFPVKMEITISSLLEFIMENAQPSVKWKTSLSLCNRNCVSKNLASYILLNREINRKAFYFKLGISLNRYTLMSKKLKYSGKRHMEDFLYYQIDKLRRFRWKLRVLDEIKNLLIIRYKNYDHNVISQIYKLVDHVEEKRPKIDEFAKRAKKPVKSVPRKKNESSSKEKVSYKVKSSKKAFKKKDEL